jgi:hypothetical protein
VTLSIGRPAVGGLAHPISGAGHPGYRRAMVLPGPRLGVARIGVDPPVVGLSRV